MNDVLSKVVRIASLAGLSFLTAGTAAADDRPLTVVSWGGSYARACVKGYHETFTAETGIKINLEDYNGGLAQIRAQVDVGNVYWDVVDLEIPDLVRGCDEGLLETIAVGSLPAGADGTPAAEDFVPGTLTECGPATIFYSTIYAYNNDNIKGDKPAT
ncbi:MAG: ABC transporter substrate-binding protein, partial [Gemmatimonadetes bacterium]|nr:ABC transporter substrate-binding protein [Gemmatimonadota bacterium]